MRAVLVALLACSAPAQPPAIGNATAPAPEPPEVTRGGTYGLTARGLPAIAADGSRVVLAVREPDGARGMPNLTLIIKDRGDIELERHVVLSVAEADQFLDDADGNNPALAARIARANDWLRDRHATARFAPLLVLEPDPQPLAGTRTRATRAGIAATWSRSHLRITDGSATLVDTRTPDRWLPQADAPGCVRVPYLGGAALDRAKQLAVITIASTTDSDLCLEPPAQHHVITW